MIFVTIGSMFPFDRLIRVMDAWAAAHPDQETLAQIGDGTFTPVHMPWVRRLSQKAFTDTVERARLVVAHAGMGSVISAGQIGRPLVMLPRRREQGEHTTDHQLATAAWLRDKSGLYVADGDADLPVRIDEALAAGAAGPTLSPHAPEAFLERIRLCLRS